MNRFSLLLLTTVLFTDMPANGQAVIKQANQGISYISPMILEVPLGPFIAEAQELPPPALFSLSNPKYKYQEFDDLAKYVCESVSIKKLVIGAFGPNKKGLQKIQFQASISVRPGSDKYVTIVYEFLSQGKSLAQARTKKMDAEEKKTTDVVALMQFQSRDITLETQLTLRITIIVEDNG